VSLRDLICELAERMGRPALIEQMPPQTGDVPLTQADISLAQRELDYDPTTTIAEGLDRFVDWFAAGPASPHTGSRAVPA
jgi:UDP-glucuronate 4-epimerase